jgi:hypothetical protein
MRVDQSVSDNDCHGKAIRDRVMSASSMFKIMYSVAVPKRQWSLPELCIRDARVRQLLDPL